MELVTNFSVLFITVLSVTCLLLLRHKKSTGGHLRLPPGPPGWPVIGNILDLGALPHRTLHRLRDKYGGVIWLRLGSKNAIAIVSAKAAAELFKHHDLSFADRDVNETMRAHGYHEGALVLAPYGPHWRVLRRLVTEDMLVAKRLIESAPIRRKCMDHMVKWVEEEARRVKCTCAGGVNVAHFVGLTLFNLTGNLVMSRDLVDPDSKVGPRFFEAVNRIVEWAGRANLADYFPLLRRLDPQGLRRAMERDMGSALGIVSTFISRRREELLCGDVRNCKKRDFLQVLLEFRGMGNEEPIKLSDNDINTLILEMFMGGSETNSSIAEWSMAELLRHPESMKSVKDELERVVGPKRKLEESDIENLPYLQAVVKESMRLHPVVPLLIPRIAIHDTKFMGYDILKGTKVFVDTWAIGRDPEVWDDPLTFKPERFMGSTIDYRGQHFEFLPFGAGRRICVGLSMADRLMHMVLGTLLHEFDWELEESVTPETLDMNEKLGITARMLNPFVAVPKKRV